MGDLADMKYSHLDLEPCDSLQALMLHLELI